MGCCRRRFVGWLSVTWWMVLMLAVLYIESVPKLLRLMRIVGCVLCTRLAFVRRAASESSAHIMYIYARAHIIGHHTLAPRWARLCSGRQHWHTQHIMRNCRAQETEQQQQSERVEKCTRNKAHHTRATKTAPLQPKRTRVVFAGRATSTISRMRNFSPARPICADASASPASRAPSLRSSRECDPI